MDTSNSPDNKAENTLEDIQDQEEEEDMPPTIFNVTPPNPGLVFPQPVGPKSMEMNCPSCRCRISTNVRHQATAKTHFACLLLSWTCCCCFLPYCMDSCRNTNHFCPMCGIYIGTYAS